MKDWEKRERVETGPFYSEIVSNVTVELGFHQFCASSRELVGFQLDWIAPEIPSPVVADAIRWKVRKSRSGQLVYVPVMKSQEDESDLEEFLQIENGKSVHYFLPQIFH